MKKNDLYRKIAEETDRFIAQREEEGFYSQQVVEDVMNAFVNVVYREARKAPDDSVKIPLPGIGNFYKKHIPEKSGISRLHGEKKWVKPAHDELCFKISPGSKEL